MYTILLDGIELGSVQTDSSGAATFTYDLSSFSGTGGPFVLESKLNGGAGSFHRAVPSSPPIWR